MSTRGDKKTGSDFRLSEEIGVLKRREIEARFIGPFVKKIEQELGKASIRKLLLETVIEIAKLQGTDLATKAGGQTLDHFALLKEPWTRNGSLEIEVLKYSETEYSFNVTRCKYAEMYRELGMEELGTLLSCARDFNMVNGFNENIKLSRTQTIMEGSSHCDFRYKMREL